MKRCAIVLLLATFAGCRSASPGPYQPLTESQRATVVAEDLNRTAADLIYTDPEEAERLLRDALTADLYHGPAHNNLGVLYLEEGKLYEAANEFEWARKLMPGAPDPRMNLTLEVAGRVEDALREYETALEVAPEHVPTMQAMARLLMERDRSDERLPVLMESIAMRGEPEAWRAWARDARARLGTTEGDRR
jgi:Tfp pilus assembly protein PilF